MCTKRPSSYDVIPIILAILIVAGIVGPVFFIQNRIMNAVKLKREIKELKAAQDLRCSQDSRELV